jgi:hypothetical protein
MIIVMVICIIFASLVLKRRASLLEAELTATRQKSRYYHEFSHGLGRDLLRSDEVLSAMTGAKASSP